MAMPTPPAAAARAALVVCDMQPDLIGSLPAETQDSLLLATKLCIDAARRAGWLIVFTGLRFPSGYAGVAPGHKLYGGLARLNSRVGDKHVHWFMEGYDGSEIEPALLRDGDAVVWRRSHLPAAELLEALGAAAVGRVAVAGLKAGYAVQATVQCLCDAGLAVTAVRECIQDDVAERLAAVLDMLLPVYADVITLADMIDNMIGMDKYTDLQVAAPHAAAAPQPEPEQGRPDPPLQQKDEEIFYATDCGRGGHAPKLIGFLLAIFGTVDLLHPTPTLAGVSTGIEQRASLQILKQARPRFLLDRPNWRAYPTQCWCKKTRNMPPALSQPGAQTVAPKVRERD